MEIRESSWKQDELSWVLSWKWVGFSWPFHVWPLSWTASLAEETLIDWSSEPYQGALAKPVHPSRPLPVEDEEQFFILAAQGQKRTAQRVHRVSPTQSSPKSLRR